MNPELEHSLQQACQEYYGELQVIVVRKRCIRNASYGTNNYMILDSPSNRFRAIKDALFFCNGDYTFLLDVDQYPENDLLREIMEQSCDAIIIPERTLNCNSFIGKLLDQNREFMEKLQMSKNDPEIPAVPRVYRTLIIKKAFQNIDSNTLDSIIQHEDSIIYFELSDQIDSLFIAKHTLFNNDPGIIEYMKKSMNYGLNIGCINPRLIPMRYAVLLQKLDRDRFSLILQHKGYLAFFATFLKGVPYTFGFMAGRISRILRDGAFT